VISRADNVHISSLKPNWWLRSQRNGGRRCLQPRGGQHTVGYVLRCLVISGLESMLVPGRRGTIHGPLPRVGCHQRLSGITTSTTPKEVLPRRLLWRSLFNTSQSRRDFGFAPAHSREAIAYLRQRTSKVKIYHKVRCVWTPVRSLLALTDLTAACICAAVGAKVR
jgi:hypothetical protein